MSDLHLLMSQVSKGGVDGGAVGIPKEVRSFIETLTFAGADEIQEALRTSLADDWMALPVWARNLAFRLLCLQRPDDAEALRQAGSDLLSFGPDWDEVAEELLSRAQELETREDR